MNSEIRTGLVYDEIDKQYFIEGDQSWNGQQISHTASALESITQLRSFRLLSSINMLNVLVQFIPLVLSEANGRHRFL